MKNLIVINSNPFNIINRLKKIDKRFFLAFNTLTKTYQLHKKIGNKSVFEFTIPYKQIDVRTILFIIKKLNESKEKVFKEIEDYNKKLQTQHQQQILNQTTYQLKEIYAYSNAGKDFVSDEAYKNLWI